MKKLLLLMVSVTFAFGALAKDVSIGYVLVGPKNDGGWSMRHDQGFQSLKKHGYTVEGVESVARSRFRTCIQETSSEARSGFRNILWVHGEYGTCGGKSKEDLLSPRDRVQR